MNFVIFLLSIIYDILCINILRRFIMVRNEKQMRSDCDTLLKTCIALYNKGTRLSIAKLHSMKFGGDFDILREIIESDDYCQYFDSYDISKLSERLLSNIGQLIYDNDENNRNNQKMGWGKYNASVTLKLVGDTQLDTMFVCDMIELHATILTDLLHSYVYPVHGIIATFGFNDSKLTKGGAISVKNILARYESLGNKPEGYNILRKMFVKSVGLNLNKLYHKYERAGRDVTGGMRDVPVTVRDIQGIYAKFIRILISADWDYHKVKEIIPTIPLDTVVIRSMNAQFNAYYDAKGTVIDKVININQDGTLILFNCSKFKYEIVGNYPEDKKYMKLSTFYKRAVIKCDTDTSTIFMKLLRYSSDIKKAGIPMLDNPEEIPESTPVTK